MEFNWKDTLATVAPTIAQAVGGPLGSVAYQFIAKAFGIEVKTPEQAEAAMATATPEQLLALKAQEQAFLLEMEKLGIERERLTVDDRKDARNREIQTRDKTPMILGLLSVGGFFGILAVMMWVAPPTSTHDLLMIMLGSLSTITIQVYNYYFGSSSGSAAKTEMLRVAIRKTAKGQKPSEDQEGVKE